MIVITGATGKLGSLVVKHLLPLVPANQIRLAVRDPSKVSDLISQGVQIGEGDYSNSGFTKTLEGCDKLFLVSAPVFGDKCINLHRQAIDAAKQAGVGCIYYTSHVGASHQSLLKDHSVTHDLLDESGIKSVILRNGFYSDNLVKFGKPGDIRVPRDGKVSWTTRDDLAKATAVLLSQAIPEEAKPEHVFLTNSTSIDYDGVAQILTRMGKPSTRTVISDEEFVEELKKGGTPAAYAGFFAAMFAASAKGDYSKVDGKLEELIGGKAKTMEEILRGGLV
ncbi:NAD(P)H dehydrogenase (quinone), partial [Tremellales sp. Uapishka_1]